MKVRASFAPLIAIGFCCALLDVSCARNDYATSAPQDVATSNASVARDDAVAATYRLAKARNLEQLSAVKPSGDSEAAVALSLFLLDAKKYRDRFVEAYPDTPDGVNGDYGSRLLRSHLLPQGANFPIDAIGNIAAAGNLTAAAKLFAAQSQATGIIADAYDMEAARVMNALPPGDALAALAALRPPLRLAAIGETNWCALKPKRILAFQTMPAMPPNTAATPAPTSSADAKAALDALPRRFAQEQIGRSVALCRLTRRIVTEKGHARNSRAHRGDSRKKNA